MFGSECFFSNRTLISPLYISLVKFLLSVVIAGYVFSGCAPCVCVVVVVLISATVAFISLNY